MKVVSLFLAILSFSAFAQTNACPDFEKILLVSHSEDGEVGIFDATRKLRANCRSWGGVIREHSVVKMPFSLYGGICQQYLPTRVSCPRVERIVWTQNYNNDLSVYELNKECESWRGKMREETISTIRQGVLGMLYGICDIQ